MFPPHPDSLENMTQVVEYVLDEKKEEEMKDIVVSDNLLCRRILTMSNLSKEMMVQFDWYKTAIDEYMQGYMYDESTTPPNPDDESNNLVDCYGWRSH